MLSTLQSLALVIGIMIASTAVLFVLQRTKWPFEKRREYNELIGWQIAVIGTTYAVVLGFMLYAVWTIFQTADSNAEGESNSIVNLVRAARGLPETERLQIRNLSFAYIDSMLSREWPAMLNQQFDPASSRIAEDLWNVATSAHVSNALEQASLSETLAQLASMSEYRRLRQLEALSGMPAILWIVLIVGGAVIIVSSCMFGSANFRVHLTQVSMLALVLSLILCAIADLSHPFQGGVRVLPSGFERARITLYSAVHR